MAKTKADLLKQLSELGHDVSALEGKTKAELEVLVREGAVEEANSEEGAIEDVNVEEEGKPLEESIVNQKEEVNHEEEPVKADVICEERLKLRVHDTRVVNLYPATTTVVVENEGGGDAYVSGDALRLSVHDIVRPGEKKVLTDTRAIIVRASSRPTLKITQYK